MILNFEIPNVADFIVDKKVFILTKNEPSKEILLNDNIILITDTLIIGKGGGFFKKIGNYIFHQLEAFQEISIFDKNGKFVKYSISGFNSFSCTEKDNGTMLFPNRNTKSHWEVDSNLNFFDTNKLYYQRKKINEAYYEIGYPDIIKRLDIDPHNKQILWEKN